MKKRFFVILIATVLLFTLSAVEALANNVNVSIKKSGTEGCFSYVENEDGTITIEMVDPKVTGSVTIPDKINKKAVTKVSTYAFWDCVNITEINIGANITQIGQMAFMNCPSLERINVAEENTAYTSLNGVLVNKTMTTLIKCPAKIEGEFIMPDTVKTIAQYSFFDCAKLTSVKLSSVLSNIPSFAFANCSSLVEIEIPSAVTDIGESAFSFCSSLENIKIPDKVFYIGASAFANCESVKTVSIGRALVYMGDLVFTGCTSLESFEVAQENTMYSAENGMLLSKNGKTLYVYPNALEEGTKIPETVTKIAPYAFYSCKTVESLTMPQTLAEIADFAFVSSTVKEIIFTGSAPKLGKNVFYDTSSELKMYCMEEYKTSFEDSSWRDLAVQVIIKGDINSDEKLNSRDIAQLQRFISGAVSPAGKIEFLNADVTGDEKLNSRDIAALQKIIAA